MKVRKSLDTTSLDPIDITSMQITKSVNGKTAKGRASDTMGMKHRIERGIYVTFGSINHQLADKTGFSDADAEIFRKALISLFENDCSSARPSGSMEVLKVVWWKHNCPGGQYSSAKVHRSLKVNHETGAVSFDELKGLKTEVYDGI